MVIDRLNLFFRSRIWRWINAQISEIAEGYSFPRNTAEFAQKRGRMRSRPTPHDVILKVGSLVHEITDCWLEQRQEFNLFWGWKNIETYYFCFNVSSSSGFTEDSWPCYLQSSSTISAFRIDDTPVAYGLTLNSPQYYAGTLVLYFCDNESELSKIQQSPKVEFHWKVN